MSPIRSLAWSSSGRSARWAILALIAAAAAPAADPARQGDVAARGSQVMPFKLSATTHAFSKTPDGAVQQVLAKDPSDSQQRQLIREHLQSIAALFRSGNFSGPTDVHGADMPGLAELKAAKAGAIAIRYRDIPRGGQITYATHDPALADALHRWIDAQLADHGADAQEGQPHHH